MLVISYEWPKEEHMNSDLYKIDFGRGKIEFNDIDNLKIGPLTAQLDNLKEDLLQVSYRMDFY